MALSDLKRSMHEVKSERKREVSKVVKRDKFRS
jgi:hypothetical protein